MLRPDLSLSLLWLSAPTQATFSHNVVSKGPQRSNQPLRDVKMLEISGGGAGHRKSPEWWLGCKGSRLCCVYQTTFPFSSITSQQAFERNVPVGVKIQARETGEGLTSSSSLGFCQDPGRNQTNSVLVENSTHPGTTCTMPWRPTKRFAQS